MITLLSIMIWYTFILAMNNNLLTYNDILSNIADNVPFAWSRWGDGEWACMLPEAKSLAHIVEVVRQRRSPEDTEIMFEYAKKMKEVLLSEPNYYIGIQNMSARRFKEDIEPYYSKLEKVCSSEMLHNASIRGDMQDLVDVLRTKKVCLVGPEYLSNLPFEFTHIVTREDDAWKEEERLINEVKKIQDSCNVFMYSVSFVSKILIDTFHNNGNIHLDTGSMWDFYVGKETRGYMKGLKSKIK